MFWKHQTKSDYLRKTNLIANLRLIYQETFFLQIMYLLFLNKKIKIYLLIEEEYKFVNLNRYKKDKKQKMTKLVQIKFLL